MSRPLRIEHSNAWYHVMNRGANKQNIFLNKKHYQMFLSLLQQIYDKYQIEIHAYCLMPNHYHLLIRARLPNLSCAMRHLNGIYTQRYNKALKRDGSLFRGRYKSILVEKDRYLLQLSRYIHLNPVTAGITNKPEEYLWSSYAAYINPQKRCCWLNTKFTLDQMEYKQKRKSYQLFVEEGVDRETEGLFKKTKMPPVIGSEIFVKNISQTYISDKKLLPEIIDHKALGKKITTNYIIKAVANYYDANINELLVSKRGFFNKPRAVAIYLSCRFSEDRLQLIAKKFSLSKYSAISQMHSRFNRKIQNDKNLEKEINLVRQAALL